MAQTFDIRFARSAGLAALFEAPASRFRWKGRGHLSISHDGITIAARRGIASLLRRAPARRIPAEDLKEVYREGAELRLEFATSASPREVVPLWTRDRAAAADIVRHLPTTRTIEIEEMPANSAAPSFRLDVRAAFALAVLLAVLVMGVVLLMHLTAKPRATGIAASGTDTTSPGAGAAPPAALDDPSGADVPVPRHEFAAAIPRGTALHATALRELEIFEVEAAALLTEFRVFRDLYESDAMPRESVADQLERRVVSGWESLESRIAVSNSPDARELGDLHSTMRDTARHWRRFLHEYARAVRAGDPVAIEASFEELQRAELLQARARRLVRD